MTGYEQDFFEWTQETARAIEAGRFEEIDRVALADEVESLGKRDRSEAVSRLAVILLHLLKLKYQPGRETRSWHDSIAEQRDRLTVVTLRQSPSLRAQLPALVAEAYELARRKASRQTGMALSTFPEACEWSVDEVLIEGHG